MVWNESNKSQRGSVCPQRQASQFIRIRFWYPSCLPYTCAVPASQMLRDCFANCRGNHEANPKKSRSMCMVNPKDIRSATEETPKNTEAVAKNYRRNTEETAKKKVLVLPVRDYIPVEKYIQEDPERRRCGIISHTYGAPDFVTFSYLPVYFHAKAPRSKGAKKTLCVPVCRQRQVCSLAPLREIFLT